MLHKTFPDRLAFVDLETTNSWPPQGEIIELGLIITESATLREVGRGNWKIQPKHIATANSEVLKINHYSPKTWAEAIPPLRAMREFIAQASGAAFCAWRVAYDFTFVHAALVEEGLFSPRHFETQICVYSVALQALRNESIQPFKLPVVARFLGVPPEPSPHQAMNGAEQALEVYKRLQRYG